MRSKESTMGALTDAQWAACEKEGYLSLGKVPDDAQLNALRDRIDLQASPDFLSTQWVNIGGRSFET
jgi:hypothetical protein